LQVQFLGLVILPFFKQDGPQVPLAPGDRGHVAGFLGLVQIAPQQLFGQVPSSGDGQHRRLALTQV